MRHECHAHGCCKGVPPAMLFCKPHWFALRKAVRDAVWREYQNGQEISKTPTLRYLAVQRLAVAEVADKDGYPSWASNYRDEAMKIAERCKVEDIGDPLEGLI
jgi:hypothetical protein